MYAVEMHTTFQLKKLVGNFHSWEGSTKIDIGHIMGMCTG